MASIKDIAKRSGYSVSTVSRVINESGYVSEAARKRILDVIEALDYRPNSIARSMVTKQSKIIGLLIPHINSPFFAGLAVTVEEEAKSLGYNVLLCHTNEDTKIEKDYLKVLMERRVDGIIATPVGKSFKHYKNASKEIPIVFVGRIAENLNINSIEVDNIGGSRKVIEHLLQLNHRKIGVINGPMFLSTGKKRWEGVKQALNENKIEIPSEYIEEGDFTIKGGYRCAMKLLNTVERPTAIFSANHLTALGVLKAVREMGLSIPGDVALASFDGFEDSEIDLIIEPKITANIHPTSDMARTAVNLVHQGVTNKMKGVFSKNAVHTSITMEFVERESTISK